jgi:hypothetical protein
MARKRNSLVENINRRKRRGNSRPKSKSTVAKESYEQMQRGWPRSRKRKAGTKRPRKQATTKRARAKR